MENNPVDEIAWAGIEFSVPKEWAINRHSLSYLDGSLVFVDRRRQRMELIWRACDKKPDLNMSCEDLKSRVREASGVAPVGLKPASGWIGFEVRIDEQTVVIYALHWERGSGRIFQANIVARDDEPGSKYALAEGVLDSFRDEGWQDRPVRWKAFGIQCVSPPGWQLVSTHVKPMDVKLQFQHFSGKKAKKEEGKATIHRLGMAESWFSGDARAFIRDKSPKLDFDFGRTDYRGHDAATATAQEETRLFFRLIGRSRIRRELAWLCEPVNSLFRVITVSAGKQAIDPRCFETECMRH